MMDDRVNILLVDDQPNNLLALESILGESQGNLVSATSGAEALRYLLQMDFAVVLLDVQMPDLDGFETATLIRKRDRSGDTPIIFLTALSRSETHVFRGYEIGAVDYIFKPCDIVNSAMNSARPLAQASHVGLTATVEDWDALVDADSNRIQQVIQNLLSNAIKFTPAGKKVELHLERLNGTLRIRVSDEGEGIDPAFLPHVFDRLRQSEGSNNRSGLGLGLAIARHIIELHQGEIIAESEGLGRGAVFTVVLPVARAAEGERQTDPDQESRSSRPATHDASMHARGQREWRRSRTAE